MRYGIPMACGSDNETYIKSTNKLRGGPQFINLKSENEFCKIELRLRIECMNVGGIERR